MKGYWLKVTAVLPASPDDWSVWHEAIAKHGPSGTLQGDTPPSIATYLPQEQFGLLGTLVRSLLGQGAVRVETEVCPEEDWDQAWKQYFQPVEVGKRFVVTPSWKECEIEPGRVPIVLDPGQAFGTGGHATTRLCLAMLEASLESRGAGARVLDLGCGSGILAIAAAMLGGEVHGTDTDPICIEASRENAARNGVEAQFALSDGGVASQDGAYDIVVSNIVAETLIELAPEVRRVLAPRGEWIVGGVIKEREAEVLAAAEAVGFRLVARSEEEGWVSATLSL